MPKQVEKKKEYLYQAKNKNNRKIAGKLFATNISIAKADLRKQGLTILKISRKKESILKRKQKISPKDLSLFFRQMSTMMKAGVSIIDSFDIVIENVSNRSFQELLCDIKSNVESGTSFNDSLKKYPIYFDSLSCSLLEAGENSGTLDIMLDRVATYKEKTEALKAKIKKAMIYPIAVISVAIIVSMILLIFVVPQFEQLFKNFGADLPYFTRIVISISRIMQSYWYICVLACIMGVYFFRMAHRKSKSFHLIVDIVIIRIPIFGDIIKKAIWARYARTLATTFAAGVPLLDCLASVSGAVNHSTYKDGIYKIMEEVSSGHQLQEAMRNCDLFSNMMVQMVAIGEESGSIDSMLDKIASFYEEEVDNKVNNLSTLLEPVIIVILGGLIGSLIVAMYLPIFQMGNAIS